MTEEERAERRRAWDRARYRRNRGSRLASVKNRYWSSPEIRAEKSEYDKKYREENREERIQYFRNYHENVTRSSWRNPEVKLKSLVKAARSRSEKRGMEFDDGLLSHLISTVGRSCPSCNKSFDMEARRVNGKTALRGMSLDRVDNSKGYVVGNVSVICWRCNSKKSNSSLEELEGIVSYIKQFNATNQPEG